LNKGGIEELVDPRLEGAYDVTELKRFSFAASLCIRASSTWRPTMTEVPYFHFFPFFYHNINKSLIKQVTGVD